MSDSHSPLGCSSGSGWPRSPDPSCAPIRAVFADSQLTRRRVIGQFAALPISVMALGAGSALLAGCDGAARSGTQREVSLWTLALSPFLDDYVRRQIASFEKTNPGVRVNWQDVPYEAIDRKLMAAAAAGRAPDVINLADRTFARFVAMGAMRDLAPLLPPGALETYLPAAARVGVIGGKQLALPWYLTTQAVLANKSVLAAGGISAEQLPTNWRDLLKMAGPFKKASGKPLFTLPLGFESDVPMMLLSDGISPLVAGTDGWLIPQLTAPAVLRAIEPWVTAFRLGHLPRESATGGSAHQTKLYSEGQVGLINSGPNFLGRIAADAPSIFAQTHVGPAITGMLGRVHLAVMTLGVTSQSRQPELAAALAMHMTSPGAQLELCRLATVLPSTTASLSDVIFQFEPEGDKLPGPEAGSSPQAIEQRVQYARAACAAALDNAEAYTPSMASWPDMRRTFEDGFKRVLLDGSDLALTMAGIERNWQSILSDNPARADALPPMVPLGAAKKDAAA